MAALRREGHPKLKKGLTLLLRSVGLIVVSSLAATAQPDETCRQEYLAFRGDSSKVNRNNLDLCVRKADSASRDRRIQQTRGEAMRLATMFFDIPEYHDEGMLAKTTEHPGGELGPVAGIYASPFLGQFTRPGQIYEQGLPGTLAALVVVDVPAGTALPSSYTDLQLQAGLNCVWLYVDPPPRPVPADYLKHLHYSARLSHPASGTPCDRAASMSSPLDVVAVTHQKFKKQSDYLGVGRFDVDAYGKPVFGFQCLNAFCEVGTKIPRDVRTPDALNRPDPNKSDWNQKSANDEEGRREVIKAWHDEQYLAMRGPDGVWRSSDVKAEIRPEWTSVALDSIDFENHWQKVATIDINGKVPTTSKYYLAGLRQGKNDLQYRFDVGGGGWQAQIVNKYGTFAWHLVRHPHFDMTVPPTARFRWTWQDDGVWAPCGNACCEATAIW